MVWCHTLDSNTHLTDRPPAHRECIAFALNVIKLTANLVFHFIRQPTRITHILCIVCISTKRFVENIPKRIFRLSNGNTHVRSLNECLGKKVGKMFSRILN